MKNCRNCPYGPPSLLSDVCDGCRNDGDTGWGGSTDHSTGRHSYDDNRNSTMYDEYESDEAD